MLDNKYFGRVLNLPRTKQMESRMLDFPVPLRPVMALNWGSNPVTTVHEKEFQEREGERNCENEFDE